MFAVDMKQQHNDFNTSNTGDTVVTNYLLSSDARLDNIKGKNIANRKTTNATYTPNFKSLYSFNNIAEILDYFLAELTKIYKKNGMQHLDYRIKGFIDYNKKIQFKGSRRTFYGAEEIYDFLCKLSLFVATSFNKPYNNIVSVIGYFFNGCKSYKPMKKDRVLFFKNTSIADIEKIAADKDLYIYISNIKLKDEISHYKLQQFSVQRQQNEKKIITEINQAIDCCKNDSRKQTINKYVNVIFQICANKYIAISKAFVIIVKELVASANISDANIEAIFKKIIIYLQAIEDENSYANISKLTGIMCDNTGKTNRRLLLSICNITDVQLQNIALGRYPANIINKWSYIGFPEKMSKHIKSSATTSQQLEPTTSIAAQMKRDGIVSNVKNSATNEINNKKSIKRQADAVAANQAKKAKRLEKIISNIASNNQQFNTEKFSIYFKKNNIP